MAFPPSEIGRRIREVREQVGVSIEALAAACGCDEQDLEKLENGTLDPVPGDYVLIVARLLKTDFRYFISEALDDVERETRQVFRALASPTPADMMAIRRFVMFCTAEQELEELLDVQRSTVPSSYPRPGSTDRLHKDQGKRAASQERERLLLGNQPIQNIFDLLRKQGVRLCRHRLEDASLSGVTVAHPKAGICVLLNYEEDMYRQFFSAAHEYGHVLFDRDVISSNGCVISYKYSRSDIIEIRANAFAAELLLPSAALTKYQRPANLEKLTDLIGTVARDYRVNTETVAIRMKECGWITEKTFKSFRKVKPVVIHRNEKTDPDIPDGLTPTQTSRYETAIRRGISSYLVELLRRGLTGDRITLGRFAEMLDMTVEEASEFIRAVGMAV